VAVTQILLTAGVVCLIAAVVGGGLKAFGIEMPLLQSVQRQVLLAVLGAGLLVGAYFTQAPHDNEPAPAQSATPIAPSNPAPVDPDKVLAAQQFDLLSREIEKGCIPFHEGSIAVDQLQPDLKAKLDHHLKGLSGGGPADRVKVVAASQLSYDQTYSAALATRTARSIQGYLVAAYSVPGSNIDTEMASSDDPFFVFPRLGQFDCLAYVRRG
jgi:hypothetical protein